MAEVGYLHSVSSSAVNSLVGNAVGANLSAGHGNSASSLIQRGMRTYRARYADERGTPEWAGREAAFRS